MLISENYRNYSLLSQDMTGMKGRLARGKAAPANEIEKFIDGKLQSGTVNFAGYEIYARKRSIQIHDETKRVFVISKITAKRKGQGRYPGLLRNINTGLARYNLDGILIEGVVGESGTTKERQVQFYLRNGFTYYGDPLSTMPNFYRPR